MMMDRTLLAVFLSVLISLFGVLGQNLTNDDTNEFLLNHLASGKVWTPQSPGAKTGSLSIGGNPILQHSNSALNRSQDRIQLSDILESKQLLKDMGLSTKTTNAMETSARTQNSTESMDFQTYSANIITANGSTIVPEVNRHVKRNSEDLTKVSGISERVTKITGSSSSRNKAKYPRYDLYDETHFKEKTSQNFQLYKMLVGLVIQHINSVNADKTQRIQKAGPNSNKNRTKLLTNNNTIQTSSKAIEDNVNPKETMDGKMNLPKTTEVNESSDRTKQVKETSETATESRKASAIVSNYSVADVSLVGEKVQKGVQLYKKLLSLVLQHINVVSIDHKPSIQKTPQNSTEELNKRFIDTLASGLIGKK